MCPYWAVCLSCEKLWSVWVWSISLSQKSIRICSSWPCVFSFCFIKNLLTSTICAVEWKLIPLSLCRGHWWGDFELNGEDKSFSRPSMEQSRLNRLCVIPDYTGAEIKARLRDLLHRPIASTKDLLIVVSHLDVALMHYGFHWLHSFFLRVLQYTK